MKIFVKIDSRKIVWIRIMMVIVWLRCGRMMN